MGGVLGPVADAALLDATIRFPDLATPKKGAHPAELFTLCCGDECLADVRVKFGLAAFHGADIYRPQGLSAGFSIHGFGIMDSSMPR